MYHHGHRFSGQPVLGTLDGLLVGLSEDLAVSLSLTQGHIGSCAWLHAVQPPGQTGQPSLAQPEQLSLLLWTSPDSISVPKDQIAVAVDGLTGDQSLQSEGPV